MKIAIIGYSGSGKSTLAAMLGKQLSLPVLHLDAVHFGPNWAEREPALVLADVRAFMAQDSWIIDGNYTKLDQAERLRDADLIISFQYNRFLCLYQAYKRFFQYRGKVRESSAPGCQEKMDWDFFWWIIRDGRTPQRRAHYRSIEATYPEKTVVLRNRRALASFLNRLSV